MQPQTLNYRIIPRFYYGVWTEHVLTNVAHIPDARDRIIRQEDFTRKGYEYKDSKTADDWRRYTPIMMHMKTKLILPLYRNFENSQTNEYRSPLGFFKVKTITDLNTGQPPGDQPPPHGDPLIIGTYPVDQHSVFTPPDADPLLGNSTEEARTHAL